jgi:hypothetical protein
VLGRSLYPLRSRLLGSHRRSYDISQATHHRPCRAVALAYHASRPAIGSTSTWGYSYITLIFFCRRDVVLNFGIIPHHQDIKLFAMSNTVILGSGIIGLSTAFYLSQSGNTPPENIHLVDPIAELFHCASGYAGGFVAEDCTYTYPTMGLTSLLAATVYSLDN